MAQATVTLRLTPQELQIIDEALRMWAYACKHWHTGMGNSPLASFQNDLTMVDGSPLQAALTANVIRKDIGLK